VNVSFSNPSHQLYVSVSGRAEVIQDKDKAKELWHQSLKAWFVFLLLNTISISCFYHRFPHELDDPNLGLLKVTIEAAEYWDSASSLMVRAVGYAKAAFDNISTPPECDNKKVNFP
jgi:general stress protein 26